MKKTRLFSRITAMLLVAIMACCMVASAYQGYSKTLYGDNGTYVGFSTLYVDGGRYNAGVFVRTSDYRNVPAGTIGAQASLAHLNDGAIYLWSDKKTNPTSDYFVEMKTGPQPSPTTAYSVGWGSVEGSVYVALPSCYIGDNYSRSGEEARQLAALAKRTLTEDNTYPVNAAGETYGSILLADMVGEEPDLIYVVNQDNEYGYVRLEDVANPNTVLSRAGTSAYTMYDVNGNVIGDFELTECELSTAPDFEAQAEMHFAQ